MLYAYLKAKQEDLTKDQLSILKKREQDRRAPTGPALALLTIIKNDPVRAIEY